MRKLRGKVILGALSIFLILLSCQTNNDDSGGNGEQVCQDADGDGFYAGNCQGSYLKVGDCDDDDPVVNPEATEVYGNQKDEDCDGKDGGDEEIPCPERKEIACILLFGPVCTVDSEGNYCYEGNECFAWANCRKVLCSLDLDKNGMIDPNSECAEAYPECVNPCPVPDSTDPDDGDGDDGDSEPSFPGIEPEE